MQKELSLFFQQLKKLHKRVLKLMPIYFLSPSSVHLTNAIFHEFCFCSSTIIDHFCVIFENIVSFSVDGYASLWDQIILI